MKAMADALVYAVTAIDLRGVEAEADLGDDDVDAFESIARFLADATDAEFDALAAAADRAHASESAMPNPRVAFVEAYGQWMENMFGNGWIGNRRARF
jgi:hypothetical protein